MKTFLGREALALIPRILTLQDRNPASPTYGCFDRNFWHYKIIDFPSGMAQEFVWPLALAYSLDLPDNPFYRQESVREWVIAGIRYAARTAHGDGSCDDYFLFEKAGGAAAFSLLACLEAGRLLDIDAPDLLEFYEKRAEWLAAHHESGRLSNHQALIVLCLELAARVLKKDPWKKAREGRLDKLLQWQNEEGWFQEYEGADPGYHTLTIGLLAQIRVLRPDPRIEKALVKAMAFAAEFVHPDGSFGGEYGSRNTYNFFPHGFELAADLFPGATAINDRILKGLEAGMGACHTDDHILGHHAWSYFLTWQNFRSDRPAAEPRSEGIVHFPRAGLLIERRGGTELYLALNKGGVFRLFRGNQCIVSDTQWSLSFQKGGRSKNAVGHLVENYTTDLQDAVKDIRGSLGWAKHKQMTPFRLILLRLIMIFGGRLFPDLIRKFLQKILITGKTKAPFTFHRRLSWISGDRLEVVDELRADKGWENVSSLGMGAAQTSIYVVMSRTFQRSQLQPWIDLDNALGGLRENEPVVVKRTY